jgi:hypothetical protein
MPLCGAFAWLFAPFTNAAGWMCPLRLFSLGEDFLCNNVGFFFFVRSALPTGSRLRGTAVGWRVGGRSSGCAGQTEKELLEEQAWQVWEWRDSVWVAGAVQMVLRLAWDSLYEIF